MGSRSVDGAVWTELGRIAMDLPETLLVGFAGSGQDLRGTGDYRSLEARICDMSLVAGGPFNQDPVFRRADVNLDDAIDSSDAIATLEYLFLGIGEITCHDSADTNDDGQVDISDPISTLGHVFLNKPMEILPPGTEDCGPDPTADSLGCESFGGCN